MPKPGEMVAFRYYPTATKPTREIVPIPSPGPHEVLIQVLAGGICHSDFGFFEPAPPKYQYQNSFTMGHEIAGVITEVGSTVATTNPALELGTYVAVPCVSGCHESSCPVCSAGKDNLCRKYPQYGIGTDGGWASYMVARAAAVVVVPGDIFRLPPPIVAVATDAVLTPYHALTSAGVHSGQTVLIIGCGGLGYNAIQIAKHCLGASCVLAVDIRESSLLAAVEAGADHAMTPDTLNAYIKETHPVINVVVDVVGSQTTIDIAITSVGHGGTVQIVGLAADNFQVVVKAAVHKDLTIRMCYCGPKKKLAEVLDAILAGKITPFVETRPLDECLQAMEDLHHGKVKSRIALIS